jgi:hypothetical protein
MPKYEILNLTTGKHQGLESIDYLDAVTEATNHEMVNGVDEFAIINNDTMNILLQFNL